MDDKRIAAAEHKHLIPLDRINGYDVRPGFYGINGATALREGVNFTVCSVEATDVELLTGSVECIPCSFLDWISLISNMPIG